MDLYISTLPKQDATEEVWKALTEKFHECLTISYIQTPDGKFAYPNGATIGNHSKVIIVDDQAYYIGSQNVYLCDLAEWGVIVDSKDDTTRLVNEWWTPKMRPHMDRSLPVVTGKRRWSSADKLGLKMDTSVAFDPTTDSPFKIAGAKVELLQWYTRFLPPVARALNAPNTGLVELPKAIQQGLIDALEKSMDLPFTKSLLNWLTA